jgi:hypothetical protein
MTPMLLISATSVPETPIDAPNVSIAIGFCQADAHLHTTRHAQTEVNALLTICVTSLQTVTVPDIAIPAINQYPTA